ncbi:MAG: TIGR03960 family B12-binding radical SAM protein [Synergistaceae bacterium]|nr:TIGR03960 family B12-binding radical SAM protein [Synergistaceae bacterium]
MTFPEFDDPLRPLLTQVSRPSRYCGSEWRLSRTAGAGTNENTLSVCLAFPDVYEIGMSYYGFQILSPLVAADRAYCPWVDMEALMRKNSLPLASMERSTPLSDFDVVGFTLQHELGYTNVLTMLDLGGIPLRSEKREDNHPIVMAGGPGAFMPEPLSSFIDIFCIGEGEKILPGLLSSLSESRGRGRGERLAECARLPGVYVPMYTKRSCHDPVRREFSLSFEETYLPDSMIVPSVGIVHDRAALEVFRGCSRGCRFCQAGMTNRPVRERAPGTIVEALIRLTCMTGWEEAGLLSLSTCDYSGIDRVIEDLTPKLIEQGVKLSLPSLRMDGFSVNLATRFQKTRRGGLTFAPEAGTQRLRDVINKGLDEESIFACLEEAFSKGWDKIKLYFMMGLPTETDDDLDGIVRLAQESVKLARRQGRKRVSVGVSVAGFVPKAHTPFQWEAQNSIEELKTKGRRLKSQVKDKAVSLKYHEPEQSFLEGVLARGDKRLGGVIERAWLKGARFDGWSETFDLTRWLGAFDECGLNPADYVRTREEHENLPWDHIDAGVTKDFLLRERAAAYAARQTPDCRHTPGRGRAPVCNACGLNCGGGSGELAKTAQRPESCPPEL